MKKNRMKSVLLALLLVASLIFGLVQSPVSVTRAEVIRQGNSGKKADIPVNLTVNGQTFQAVFYNNKTANALLKKMPMTLNMKELNGNEKYHYFDTEFPTNEKSPGKISAGDIMLYGSDCLVTFYKSHNTSYQYTPVGRIENASDFAKAVGSRNVTITFKKPEILLKIDNRTVSGKTLSITKGKKKKINVIVPQKKNCKITFRSNKSSIAAVSKTGKITAKRIGTAKVTVTAESKQKKYTSWMKVKVVSANKENDVPLPTQEYVPSQTAAPTVPPSASPTIIPSAAPTVSPSVSPTIIPSAAPTVLPSDTPTVTPSDTPPAATVSPTKEPAESFAPDTGIVSDMYEITIRVNEKEFPAKLYQTETTKSIMQKLPLSITMDELNGNEKYYYFSESFPTDI